MKINLQTEKDFVDHLIKMVPVPWTKIAFYGESDSLSRSFFFGLREEETNMVITMDNYSKRYDEYAYPIEDMLLALMRFLRFKFYREQEKMGDKVWREFVCTIEKNGEYKFEYFYPGANLNDYKYMSRADFLMKYFDSEYGFVKGKYPSTEYIPESENHLL